MSVGPLEGAMAEIDLNDSMSTTYPPGESASFSAEADPREVQQMVQAGEAAIAFVTPLAPSSGTTDTGS